MDKKIDKAPKYSKKIERVAVLRQGPSKRNGPAKPASSRNKK